VMDKAFGFISALMAELNGSFALPCGTANERWDSGLSDG